MAAAAIALVAAAVAVADVAVSGCKLQLSPAGAINNKRKSVNHCGNGQVQSSMEDEQEQQQQQQQHVDSDKQLAKTDEGFISCGGVVGSLVGSTAGQSARINLHLHLQSRHFVFGQRTCSLSTALNNHK